MIYYLTSVKLKIMKLLSTTPILLVVFSLISLFSCTQSAEACCYAPEATSLSGTTCKTCTNCKYCKRCKDDRKTCGVYQ